AVPGWSVGVAVAPAPVVEVAVAVAELVGGGTTTTAVAQGIGAGRPAPAAASTQMWLTCVAGARSPGGTWDAMMTLPVGVGVCLSAGVFGAHWTFPGSAAARAVAVAVGMFGRKKAA